MKKTEQYAEQATALEVEYDRLFTEEGISKDPELGGSAAIIKIND